MLATVADYAAIWSGMAVDGERDMSSESICPIERSTTRTYRDGNMRATRQMDASFNLLIRNFYVIVTGHPAGFQMEGEWIYHVSIN